jgi:hypothetical protein
MSIMTSKGTLKCMAKYLPFKGRLLYFPSLSVAGGTKDYNKVNREVCPSVVLAADGCGLVNRFSVLADTLIFRL